jgi:hypothetical protein
MRVRKKQFPSTCSNRGAMYFCSMENQPRDKKSSDASTPLSPEELRELEAKKKLALPPKDKTEVIIGPTDRSGPDVVIS